MSSSLDLYEHAMQPHRDALAEVQAEAERIRLLEQLPDAKNTLKDRLRESLGNALITAGTRIRMDRHAPSAQEPRRYIYGKQ